MLSVPPTAPVVLPAARLAEVLAILTVDIVEAMQPGRSTEILTGLANRLDEQGRTPNGTAAAAMLGCLGSALMRLER